VQWIQNNLPHFGNSIMGDKLYWDEPGCEYSSPYSLLCETVLEAKKVDKMIDTALENCAKRIKEIEKKFPKAGIGDTATDECISEIFLQ